MPLFEISKVAQTESTAGYTFEGHLEGKRKHIQALTHNIREFVMDLDSAIKEVPGKCYVAYRTPKNFVCMVPLVKIVKLWIKLDRLDVPEPPKSFKDVSTIGHWGTGDVEFTISSQEEFEEIKQYIRAAYKKMRGHTQRT